MHRNTLNALGHRQWYRAMKHIVPVIQKSGEKVGPIEELIIAKLSASLEPSRLVVKNDSHKHRHHQPMKDATNVQESHFRIEIESEAFKGKSLPARHRVVYALLEEEFNVKGLHALQMTTKTAQEAEAKRRSKS